ncbi:unnamed protein product [Bursaphelenchus xylophilus]|uniref:(pine wood nematode) hypothetical protein n=1 Tax=Bursaphelenchus xylophilus TaxID=6326 RepID=A0A1I7RT30_BURXY|nr:unnamed protein product [Bursaphelenchus xylophilus]CAG9122650.1 unnamed protein product [Bursaphelenchus xylophilus]
MSWKETDPVALWKTSSVIPNVPEINVFDKGRPDLSPKNTSLWKTIQEMSALDQKTYLRSLCKNWPFRTERYAIQYAQHPLCILNGITGFYIANRINASVFLNNPRAGFLETIKTTPKVPSVFFCYACSMMTFGFWEILIRTKYIESDKPCTSCLLPTGVMTAVGIGTLLPLVTTPFLCHSILLYTLKNEEKYLVKNVLEAFCVITEYSKHVRTKVPLLIILQTLLASGAIYAHAWANEKIYNSFEVDADLINETVKLGERKGKISQMLENFFSSDRFSS